MIWLFAILQIVVVASIARNDKHLFPKKSDDIVKCSTLNPIALTSAQTLCYERLKRNKFNYTGGIKNKYSKINSDDCNYSVNMNDEEESSHMKHQFKSDQNKLKSFKTDSNLVPSIQNNDWMSYSGKANDQYSKSKSPVYSQIISDYLDNHCKRKLDQILSRNAKKRRPKVGLIPRYRSRMPLYLSKRDAVSQRPPVNKKFEFPELISKLWNHRATFKGQDIRSTVKGGNLSQLIDRYEFQEQLPKMPTEAGFCYSYYLSQIATFLESLNSSGNQMTEKAPDEPEPNETNCRNIIFSRYPPSKNCYRDSGKDDQPMNYHKQMINNKGNTKIIWPDLNFMNNMSFAFNRLHDVQNKSKHNRNHNWRKHENNRNVSYTTPAINLQSNKNNTSGKLESASLDSSGNDERQYGIIKSKAESYRLTTLPTIINEGELVCSSKSTFDWCSEDSKDGTLKIAPTVVNKTVDRLKDSDLERTTVGSELIKGSGDNVPLKTAGSSVCKRTISGTRRLRREIDSEVDFGGTIVANVSSKDSNGSRNSKYESILAEINSDQTTLASDYNRLSPSELKENGFGYMLEADIEDGTYSSLIGNFADGITEPALSRNNFHSQEATGDGDSEDGDDTFNLRTTAYFSQPDVSSDWRATPSIFDKDDFDVDLSAERIKTSSSKIQLQDFYNKLKTTFSNLSCANDLGEASTVADRQESQKRKHLKHGNSLDMSQLNKKSRKEADAMNKARVDKAYIETSFPNIINQFKAVDLETLSQVSDMVSTLWKTNTWPNETKRLNSSDKESIDIITSTISTQLCTDTSSLNVDNGVSTKTIRSNQQNVNDPISHEGNRDEFLTPTENVLNIYNFKKHNLTRFYSSSVGNALPLDRTTCVSDMRSQDDKFVDRSSTKEANFNTADVNIHSTAKPGVYRLNFMKGNSDEEVENYGSSYKKTTPFWINLVTMTRYSKTGGNKMTPMFFRPRTSYAGLLNPKHSFDKFTMKYGDIAEIDVSTKVREFYSSKYFGTTSTMKESFADSTHSPPETSGFTKKDNTNASDSIAAQPDYIYTATSPATNLTNKLCAEELYFNDTSFDLKTATENVDYYYTQPIVCPDKNHYNSNTNIKKNNSTKSCLDPNTDKKSSIIFINIFNNYTDLVSPEMRKTPSLFQFLPIDRNVTSNIKFPPSKIIFITNSASDKGGVQAISKTFIDARPLTSQLETEKSPTVDLKTDINTFLNKSALSGKQDDFLNVFGTPFNRSGLDDAFIPSNRVIETILMRLLTNNSDHIARNGSRPQHESGSTSGPKQMFYSMSQPFYFNYSGNDSASNYSSLFNETSSTINSTLTQGVDDLLKASTNQSKPDRFYASLDKSTTSNTFIANNSQSVNTSVTLAPGVGNTSETINDNLVSSSKTEDEATRSVTLSNFPSTTAPDAVLVGTTETTSGEDIKIPALIDLSTQEEADKSTLVAPTIGVEPFDILERVTSPDGDHNETSSVENEIEKSLVATTSTEDWTSVSQGSSKGVLMDS